MRSTDELIRVSLNPDDRLVLGPNPGRGAWLCRASAECLAAAEKRSALARALRHPVLEAEMSAFRDRLIESARMDR